MSYLSADPSSLLETRKALATAIGYPVKGRCYRDGVEVFGVVPAEYVPGLWCEYEPEIVVSDDGTVAAMAVPIEHEVQLGKTIKVAGKSVKIAGRAALVTKEALPTKVTDVIARAEALAVETPVDQPLEPADAVDPKIEGEKVSESAKRSS